MLRRRGSVLASPSPGLVDASPFALSATSHRIFAKILECNVFRLFLAGNSVSVMTETHEDISIIRHGDTLDVVFNRPEKHNALTPQMYDAIAGACRSADSDREIRLLTLRGAGG
ncbi:enoyl-CoA hydratase, partial [Rhodococcus erythropolis]|nr:enoyl-CoA hydratase [Rhodococcus erythropolis]